MPGRTVAAWTSADRAQSCLPGLIATDTEPAQADTAVANDGETASVQDRRRTGLRNGDG